MDLRIPSGVFLESCTRGHHSGRARSSGRHSGQDGGQNWSLLSLNRQREHSLRHLCPWGPVDACPGTGQSRTLWASESGLAVFLTLSFFFNLNFIVARALKMSSTLWTDVYVYNSVLWTVGTVVSSGSRELIHFVQLSLCAPWWVTPHPPAAAPSNLLSTSCLHECVKWKGAVLSSWVWLISRSVMTSRFRARVRIAFLLKAWMMLPGIDGPHCLAYRCGTYLACVCWDSCPYSAVLTLIWRWRCSLMYSKLLWSEIFMVYYFPDSTQKNHLFPVIYVLARNPGFTEVSRLCARKSRTFQAFPTRLVIIC